MIRLININELHEISGGCGECQVAIVDSLYACSMDQLYTINQVFKQVLLNEDMLHADGDTKRAALIAALENFQF
jgi:hypothetical protein